MATVLIFDDDRDILELCSLILATKGHLAVGESTTKDVISRVKEVNPHVIIMDNWIPGLGGIEASRLLKNTVETRSIPLIFFSANNNVENISQEAGADYFIRKPFDIAQLELMIRKAIENHPVNISR